MYAIIETGGKQYKVQEEMLVKVEKLDANVGDKVALKAILVADKDGKIVVGDAAGKTAVMAEVTKHDKSAKILVCKYKAKKNIRKRQGHRQPYTELKIVSIG
ncbi:MAG TPA: 50S ribosomal protein L21 [Clostridia bacterium]|nr:50S ribosomal protein L21 [Clostridia bacterium]